MVPASPHHLVTALTLSLWLALAVPALGGEATADHAPVDTPAGQDLEATVTDARAAVAAGVAYLRQRMTDDLDGWVQPPQITSRQRVVGHTEVERRYRRVTRTVPRWENEYEEVTVPRVVRDGSGVEVRERTIRRRVGRRQVGEREVTRLVRDPEGPIVRTRRQPIREREQGPPRFQHGVLAKNAMALYVMLEAGVDGEDPQLGNLADMLRQHIEEWGLPDRTWDLAWLTAAFSLMPDQALRELAEEGSAKLLAGQVRDGSAAGLWGPICVDLPMFARLLAYQPRIRTELERLERQAEANPNDRRLQQRLGRAEDYNRYLAHAMRDAGRDAVHFDNMTGTIVQREDGEVVIRWWGVPYYVFNQITVDIDSTAIALFALGVAAEAETLADTSPIVMGADGRPLLPPVNRGVVFRRALDALNRLQKRDGTWDEVNLFEPVRLFDRLRVPDVPLPFRLPRLEAPVTERSIFSGYRAAAEAQRLLAMETHRPLHIRMVPQAREAVAGAIENWPSGGFNLASPEHPRLTELTPFAELAPLAGLHRGLTGHGEIARREWARLADQLTAAQNEDGSWGGGQSRSFDSSSVRARIAAMAPLEHALAQQRRAADRRRPFDEERAIDRAFPSQMTNVNTRLIATCHALLFLVDGLRTPVATLWTPPSQPDAAAAVEVLELALDPIDPRTAGRLTFTQADDALAGLDPSIAPLLLAITDRDTALPDEVLDRAAAHVERGGMVTVLSFHQAATHEAGKAVLDALMQRIGDLEPVAAAEQQRLIGAADLRDGQHDALRSFKRENRGIILRHLKVGRTHGRTARELRPSQVAVILSNDLLRLTRPHLLDPKWPVASEAP